MKELDPKLAALAREHDGLVTRTLALAHHIRPSVLEAALGRGALVRLRPGLFVDGDVGLRRRGPSASS